MFFRDQADDIFKRGMMSALRKYTPEEEISKLKSPDLDAIRLIWDETQEGLKCCGVESYTDWQDGTQWVKKHSGDVPGVTTAYSLLMSPQSLVFIFTGFGLILFLPEAYCQVDRLLLDF